MARTTKPQQQVSGKRVSVAPTLLDRLIGWADPRAGLQRFAARQTLARAYLAASPGDSWRPRRAGASANADHQADAAALRAKSRFLIQNVDYIAAGMNARVAHLVGTGIVPRWSGPDGEALGKLWARWVNVCDADGILNYYAIQALAARTLDQDGEVLIRLRPRLPQDGLPVPLQLQVLEIDWLDSTRQVSDNGNDVVSGKEYDALGKCVAYWLWDAHPGEPGLRARLRTQSRRVPADKIIHLYAPSRPGQSRGFPRLAPVITRARDLQLLEDAELQRKNLEGRLGALVSGDANMLTNPSAGEVDANGNLLSLQPGSLGELSSGGITNVGAGNTVTLVEPKAAPGFVDYCKWNVHLVCAGGGFTYEQATGDMREVNFSSARIRQIDFRREMEQLQWHCIVPILCERVCAEFAAFARLGGKVRANAAYELEHSTPKWDYVNPKDEVTATLDEISGGLTSFSEAARRRNDDPAIRRQELADDIAEFKKLGIWDDLVALRNGDPSRRKETQEATANPPKPAATKAA